jgi:hypothetical protein
MTLSELQSNVTYRKRDTTESFISNDEIKSYFNEGLRKIQAEYDWDWTKTSTTFTYTDGSIRYALSSVASDYKLPIDVFYKYNYQFELISPDDFMALSSYGTNNMFAKDGDYMLVKTSFGTGTLTLNYYSTHTAKTSAGSWLASLSATTDEPLMPVRFQDLLTNYAAARCYQKEGKLDDYQIAYNDFLVGMAKMKREYPSRKRNAINRMRHINEFAVAQQIPNGKENPLHQ